MADIVDRHVVVLTPKERNGCEFLSSPHHVQRGSLPLTLRNDPVFNSNVLARVRVGPARDVARGKYALHARFTVGIAVRADVACEADVVSMFDTVDAQLGPLAALVNNAGIVGKVGRVEDVAAATIRAVLELNVLGAMLGADCGFAAFAASPTVHPTIAWAKLASLVEGARLASAELWP